MSTDKNLTTMVKDITYFFIKHHYDKELVIRNVRLLDEENLKGLIERLYYEKKDELKKYIRETLKENLGSNYSSISTENILMEMFTDPEYSKHRVFLEIMEYQKHL